MAAYSVTINYQITGMAQPEVNMSVADGSFPDVGSMVAFISTGFAKYISGTRNVALASVQVSAQASIKTSSSVAL